MSTAASAVSVNKASQNSGRRRAERLGVEERRKQLLELGVKIVGTRRYEEPWLEEVARTADISKGLIYHYFDTKRGYYVAILRFIAQGLARRWTDTVTPLIEQGAKADAVTVAGLEAYMDYAQDYPAAFRTLIEAGGGIDPEVKKVDAFLRDQIIGHVTRFYGQDELSATMKAGVKGWAAFAEQVSLDWLENDSIKREDVVEMARSVLRSMFPAQR